MKVFGYRIRRFDFILLLVIVALFSSLALEMMYIQSILIDASMTKEQQCTKMCTETGKVSYFASGSCFCKDHISLEKRWHCFYNVEFKTDKTYNKYFDPKSMRDIAVSAITQYSNPNAIETKILSIYNNMANRIYYVSDPRKDEYIAKPIETWKVRGGDCDDSSLLLASMYESIGIDASLVEVYNKTYGHVFVILKIDDDLNRFMERYEKILEKHTPYSGKLPLNFILIQENENQCSVINESLKEGNSVPSFYLIVESTTKKYPGAHDCFNNFENVKFINIGK